MDNITEQFLSSQRESWRCYGSKPGPEDDVRTQNSPRAILKLWTLVVHGGQTLSVGLDHLWHPCIHLLPQTSLSISVPVFLSDQGLQWMGFCFGHLWQWEILALRTGLTLVAECRDVVTHSGHVPPPPSLPVRAYCLPIQNNQYFNLIQMHVERNLCG